MATGTGNPPGLSKAGATLRILVAEDDPINQRIIAAILQNIDCQFDIVGNGREAAEAAARCLYDLILMDIQMPEMDGIEATQHIRELDEGQRRVPIIAVTANTVFDTADACRAVGMDDLVPKPLTAGALFTAMARHLRCDLQMRPAAPLN